ncbi:MAG TPA: hypothetical protein VKQ32_19505 [Polyangia bacterium]|nr:hypothetical protein [Polyangia bacterium]
MTPGEATAPNLPGTPTLEDSYQSLVDRLPPRLRDSARRLPWTLGLTGSPDGGWGDFVGLHPNRHLPIYAAQAPDGRLGIADVSLHRFLQAHHLGGFAWLLRDRIEDGQVVADDLLNELGDIFDQRAREAMAIATADVPLADLLCRRAAARWRRGTQAERQLLAGGALRPPIYAAVVREKLSWIGAPSQALLLTHGDPRRLTQFVQAHDLFLLGLQTIDDFVDMKQDRALHGSDIPAALRCSPGALVRVAPKLLQRAADVASGGGFTWFATWLEAFARSLAAWRLAGDALTDELDAIGIAGEIEEAAMNAPDLIVRARVDAMPAAAPA